MSSLRDLLWSPYLQLFRPLPLLGTGPWSQGINAFHFVKRLAFVSSGLRQDSRTVNSRQTSLVNHEALASPTLKIRNFKETATHRESNPPLSHPSGDSRTVNSLERSKCVQRISISSTHRIYSAKCYDVTRRVTAIAYGLVADGNKVESHKNMQYKHVNV